MADLQNRLPKTYPKLAPQLAIDSAQGISPAQLDALKDLLATTSKSLLGSEMIYELATTASTFVTENNTVVRFGKLTSLKEDRAKREEELEQVAATQARLAQLEAEKLQEIENKRLQSEMERDERRKQILREERLKAEREANPIHEASSENASGLVIVERFDKPLRLPGNLQADLLVQGAAMGSATVGELYHAEAVASARHGIRLPATLQIIDLHIPYFSTVPGQRRLERLEDEIAETVELRHANVLATYGCCRRNVVDLVSQGWRICIVTEPLPRSTIADLLEDCGELPLGRALPYLRGIAAGIKYIHSQQVGHRRICAKNVYVGRTEHGEVVVKLGCTSWLQSLLDINRSNAFLEVEPASVRTEWRWPGLVHNPLAIDDKQDIWDFGVLALQLLQGSDVVQRYRSPVDASASSALCSPAVRCGIC